MEADRPAPWDKPPLLRSPPPSGGRSRAPAPRAERGGPGSGTARGSQLSAWCREASGMQLFHPVLLWAVSRPHATASAPSGAPSRPPGSGGAQMGPGGPEPPAYLIQAGNETRGRAREAEALLNRGEAALEVGTVQQLAELQEAMAEHEHLQARPWPMRSLDTGPWPPTLPSILISWH